MTSISLNSELINLQNQLRKLLPNSGQKFTAESKKYLKSQVRKAANDVLGALPSPEQTNLKQIEKLHTVFQRSTENLKELLRKTILPETLFWMFLED